MADRLSEARRSLLMAKVKSKNTKPELRVRQLAHRLGYRFRLHRKDLPGRPDVVFPGKRAVIFVHGCFWHRHPGCPKSSTPRSRVDFWLNKFARNTERDAKALDQLAQLGWRTLVIWECETCGSELKERLRLFLESRSDVEAHDHQ